MASKQGEGVSFLKALDEVRDATNNVSRSKVDVILNQLESSNKAMFDDFKLALEDTTYSASNISKTLKGFGYSISDSYIKRWRQVNNG